MKKLTGKINRALAILLSAAMAASVMPVGSDVPGGAAYAAEAELGSDVPGGAAYEAESEGASNSAPEESKAPESGNEESASAKESVSDEEAPDASASENAMETEETSSEYESETAESDASQELLGADGELTMEEMPDETLRILLKECLKDDIDSQDPALTPENLAKIRSLNIYANGSYRLNLKLPGITKAIRQLKGIEYLINLENLHIVGQDITDISVLSTASLPKLRALSLWHNQIQSLPNLTNLSALTRIELLGNRIPQEEFADSKMPASLLENKPNWIEKEKTIQRDDGYIRVSSAYPYDGVTNSFYLYVETSDMRANYRDMTVTAQFDGGTTYTLDEWGDSYNHSCYMLKITDQAKGDHTVTLRAEESYGGEVITKTMTISLLPDEPDMDAPVWLNDYEHPGKMNWIGFGVYVPYQEGEEPTKAELRKHGTNTIISTAEEELYHRLPEGGMAYDWWYDIHNGGCPFSEHPVEIRRKERQITGFIDAPPASEVKPSDSYDLIITTNKGTYTYENYVLATYPGPLITAVSDIRYGITSEDNVVVRDDVYDNAGEYFYIKVGGEYLNTDCFSPVLKLRNGTIVADEAQIVGGSSVYYKLKKKAGFPTRGDVYFDIVQKEGQPKAAIWRGAFRRNLDTDFRGSMGVLYNAKKKKYILYTDSFIPNGTKISLEQDHGEFGKVTAAVVKSGDEMEVDFACSDGTPFVPPYINSENMGSWSDDFTATVEAADKTRTYSGYIKYTESGFGKMESYSAPFRHVENVGYCWIQDGIAGSTVEIYSDRGGERLASIFASETNHTFTKEELQPVIAQDPNLEKLYKLAIWKGGILYATLNYANIAYSDKKYPLQPVNPQIKPTSIKLDKASAAVATGSTLTLTATLSPANAATAYTWTSSNPEVAAVDGASWQATVNALKAGTATITVKTGNNKSASCTVKVRQQAVFNAGLYQGEARMEARADGSYSMSIGDTSFCLKNETNGNSRLITYKISDKSVVKMGGIESKDGAAKIPLTPLKAGTALLTVAANDGLDTKQEFVICVTNAAGTGSDEDKAALAETISLNRTSVSVNPAFSVSDAAIAVYSGFGGTLENAGLAIPTGSKLAGIKAEIIQENGKNTNEIRFSAEDGKTPVGGTGKLTVTLKAGGVDIEQIFDVNVAVKEIAPSVTVKQLDKLNTFYKNKPGRFSIGSPDGVIEDVTLKAVTASASDASMAKGADYAFANGVITINKVPEGTKKLDFTVKVAGYKSGVEKKNIVLAAETANLRLSTSSGTVYIGDNVRMSTSVRLFDKATGMAVDLSGADVEIEKYDGASKKYIAAAGYTPNIKGEKLVLTASVLPAASGDKLKLKFTSTDWNEDKAFYFTVKGADIAKAALALGKTSLILYNYSDKPAASAETALTLKGGSEELLNSDKIAFEDTGAKKALNKTLAAAYADGMVKVSKMPGAALEAGSYKLKISASGPWTNPLTANLTVKVVNVDMAENSSSRAKAAISAQGTIDVLNRAGTPIVITPKFTNVPADAKVTGARLAGQNAGLFDIVGQTGSQVTAALKENAAVSTKPETPYRLEVIYTIQAGDTVLTLESNSVNIKLTQKKPKVKVSGENVFSSTRSDTKPVRFALTNSIGALIGAKRVVLTDSPGDFTYDFSKGELVYTPRGATSSGQSYTLKFEVSPAGGGINEKPLTVSYKVKIAK